MLAKHLEEAARLVRRADGRVTGARIQVLGALLKAREALSHRDIEASLQPGLLDRVTLYRVLDWLVDKGLAHRISGTDRMWRFSIAGTRHSGHAHFHCDQCGKLLCLDQSAKQNIRLPRGYRTQRVELTVEGLCADCN